MEASFLPNRWSFRSFIHFGKPRSWLTKWFYTAKPTIASRFSSCLHLHQKNVTCLVFDSWVLLRAAISTLYLASTLPTKLMHLSCLFDSDVFIKVCTFQELPVSGITSAFSFYLFFKHRYGIPSAALGWPRCFEADNVQDTFSSSLPRCAV